MASIRSLLEQTSTYETSNDTDAWFSQIADGLLNGVRVMVGGVPHRFTEVEFYYNSQAHPDTFTHGDAIQHICGRWYFHRTDGQYRSASFKGLDISFGTSKTPAGVLIRGIEKPDASLIDGPSLTVDHLLATTGFASPAELDKAIADRSVWDTTSPLHLVDVTDLAKRPLYRSARIGLTLKRSGKSPQRHRFILAPYRFISEPSKIKKGRLLLILSLHQAGKTTSEIQKLTGSTAKMIEASIEKFNEGKTFEDFTPFAWKDLDNDLLAQLHGLWSKFYGGKTSYESGL